MTEEEAKTKWCPHRRLTEIGNVRITNIDPGIHTLNCIGSACMMWREQINGAGSGVSSFYCGLAGKS